MTLVDIASITARDAAVPKDRACICDAASFWDGARCAVCGHTPDVHGDDPSRCAVRLPYRLTQAEADRRALLAILRDVA